MHTVGNADLDARKKRPKPKKRAVQGVCYLKEAEIRMFGGHVWYQKEVGNIFRIKKQKVKKIKSYMSSKKNPKIWVSDYFLAGSKFSISVQMRLTQL